jgi:hypothetical protein
MIATIAIAALQAPNPAIFLSISETGRQWRVYYEPIVRMGYAPDAVVLSTDSKLGRRGELILFFLDAATNELYSIRSTNTGAKWSNRERVSVDGAGGPPSIAVAEDGTLRLFLANENGISAFKSEDSRTFEPIGLALNAPGSRDPEVIQFDGEWLLFVSIEGEVRMATSKDGVSFAMTDQFRMRGSSPGAYIAGDKRLRLFFPGAGIWSRVRRDDGTFASEAGYHLTPVEGTQIGNPSPVLMPSGLQLLFCDVSWTPKN